MFLLRLFCVVVVFVTCFVLLRSCFIPCVFVVLCFVRSVFLLCSFNVFAVCGVFVVSLLCFYCVNFLFHSLRVFVVFLLCSFCLFVFFVLCVCM